MVGHHIMESAVRVEGLTGQLLEMAKNRQAFTCKHAAQVGPLGINKYMGYRYVVNALGLARSHYRLGPFLAIGGQYSLIRPFSSFSLSPSLSLFVN